VRRALPGSGAGRAVPAPRGWWGGTQAAVAAPQRRGVLVRLVGGMRWGNGGGAPPRVLSCCFWFCLSLVRCRVVLGTHPVGVARSEAAWSTPRLLIVADGFGPTSRRPARPVPCRPRLAVDRSPSRSRCIVAARPKRQAPRHPYRRETAPPNRRGRNPRRPTRQLRRDPAPFRAPRGWRSSGGCCPPNGGRRSAGWFTRSSVMLSDSRAAGKRTPDTSPSTMAASTTRPQREVSPRRPVWRVSKKDRRAAAGSGGRDSLAARWTTNRRAPLERKKRSSDATPPGPRSPAAARHALAAALRSSLRSTPLFVHPGGHSGLRNTSTVAPSHVATAMTATDGRAAAWAQRQQREKAGRLVAASWPHGGKDTRHVGARGGGPPSSRRPAWPPTDEHRLSAEVPSLTGRLPHGAPSRVKLLSSGVPVNRRLV